MMGTNLPDYQRLRKFKVFIGAIRNQGVGEAYFFPGTITPNVTPIGFRKIAICSP
jgi:hypothetical protein